MASVSGLLPRIPAALDAGISVVRRTRSTIVWLSTTRLLLLLLLLLGLYPLRLQKPNFIIQSLVRESELLQFILPAGSSRHLQLLEYIARALVA